MPLLHFLSVLLPLPFLCWSASSSQQASQQKTQTTSGAASPVASESGTAATTGSIAVGSGGQYQESGAIDVGGAPGETITIGDQDAYLQQIASALSGDSGSGGGAGTTVIVPTTATPATSSSAISYKTLALIGAGIVAVLVLFWISMKGKRT